MNVVPTVKPKRILIAGRGTAGISLARDAERAGEIVVGYLDDNSDHPETLGRLEDVAAVCRAEEIDVVYFAIPSASSSLVRDFVSRVPHPEVALAIIPRTYRIVARDRVSLADLTDLDVLDLVGRAPVKHDLLDARKALSNRRIMVTGAAGSIGSRIVAQLQALSPQSILCVDRNESGVFHLGQQLGGSENIAFTIGDVQSEGRMSQIMQAFQPEYLFHVAAYKHVPLMQENPVEAFNNNVWGTLNLFRQAIAHGVKQVVYVSTDKAVHPTNVMGATKRLGELLLAALAETDCKTQFSGVRFGNVLESEGSVMQTFRRQLDAGVNLTVTHPDITRYFMTIDEAAQLVIQTATSSKQGDLFVLDMGEPIRVLDLAQALIQAVNPALSIDLIGLRPGEKMFEELSYDSAKVASTGNSKIFILTEENDKPERDVLTWIDSVAQQTRNYSMTDTKLVDELRRFGFAALQ